MPSYGPRRSARWTFAGGLGVVMALVSPIALRAQDTEPRPEAWDLMEDAVRHEIAERWNVSDDGLVLEWGPHAGVGELAPGSGAELVGNGANGQWVVRIEGERGTVGVRLRAGVVREQPTAAQAFDRGHIVEVADIKMESRTLWGPPAGASVAGADIVGWVAQRRVTPGMPLAAPTVAPPAAVRSGDPVEVHWATGSVRLTLHGRAMGTARIGESVLVKLDTGKRLRGTAQADGTVSVMQPRPLEN